MYFIYVIFGLYNRMLLYLGAILLLLHKKNIQILWSFALLKYIALWTDLQHC